MPRSAAEEWEDILLKEIREIILPIETMVLRYHPLIMLIDFIENRRPSYQAPPPGNNNRNYPS